MNLSYNYSKASSFLLICFSGFYLTGILPVSPVYFTFLLAFVIFTFGNILKNKTTLQRLSIPIIGYVLYILISQPLKNPNVGSLINILFSLSYLLVVLNTINHLEKDVIVKYSKYFVIFTIILLSIEAFWRLSHPVYLIEGTSKDLRESEGLLFYAFKISSIMFQDSNFVGTYGLITYFFYLYLFREKFVQSKFPLIILGFLIILTLSRSAILTLPITYFLIYITKKNGSFIYQLIFLFGLILGSFFLYDKLLSDGSFQSKFIIVDLSIEYLKNSSLLIFLTGIGYGNTLNLFGIGAHNLVITHIIESGIIGLFFFLFVNIIFIKGSERKSLYVTIPLFVSGMSLTGHSISFYFACLAIIYTINKKDGQNISDNTYV